MGDETDKGGRVSGSVSLSLCLSVFLLARCLPQKRVDHLAQREASQGVQVPWIISSTQVKACQDLGLGAMRVEGRRGH